MISTSGLCFVLALASTLAADQKPKPEVGDLFNEISTKVSEKMVLAAKHVQTNDTQDLQAKMLSTMEETLKGMIPKIKEAAKVSGQSEKQVAKDLAHKITENKPLMEVVSTTSDGKQTPRVVGAFVLGVTQIATDVVKMALTRY